MVGWYVKSDAHINFDSVFVRKQGDQAQWVHLLCT